MSAAYVNIIFLMKAFGNQASPSYLVRNAGVTSDLGSTFSELWGLSEMVTLITLLLHYTVWEQELHSLYIVEWGKSPVFRLL